MQSARFDICWDRRCSNGWHRSSPRWFVDAILTERVLLEGRPQLKIVGRLSMILEDRLADVAERDRFWHDARARLGRLRRLQRRDVDQIEALLAKKVPRPVPVQSPE